MLVKARHGLFYNGQFHAGGDAFEVSTAEADMLSEYVEIAETPLTEATPAEEPAPRRGRKKKTEPEEG